MWNLARITEPNGAKTTYIYNQENLLGRIKYADGAVVRYTYDANGNRISEEDENGGQTSFGYDALGRVTEVKGEEGLHYRYAYDGEGNLISAEDALGNVVQMEYDSAGNLLKETNPLGESRSYTYTALGDLESVTDEAGRTTRYRYYPGGLLEKIQNPDGTEESYSYDAAGNVRTHTYATGFVISYFYDCMGRITEIQGNNGEKKNYTYDALGNVTSMTDGKGNVTKYEYTYSGQLKKVTDAFGNETEYSYDLCDRLIEIRQYGADGSLLTQQEETGQENLSTWCLDPELLEAEKQNGRNRLCQVTRYTRDLRGRVTGITDALGQKEAYTYDPKGQLLSKLDKEGYLTKYVYTKQGDVSGIQYADGREVKMSYNPLRQLMEVQDWIGLTKIQNDALGRAVKVTYPDKKEVAYTYGKAGERRSMTYPDGRTVYYGYDEQVRLSELKEGERIITYGYDSFGRLKEKNFPNGTRTTYAYDEKSQLRELLHTDKEGILDRYTYEYDLLGNKTGITKERRNLEEESGAYTYGYDALERLSSIHKDGIRQTRYTYDAFGNRTGKEEQGTQIRYRYNSLNQLVSLTDQNAGGSVSREIYRYDRRGNLSQILKDGQVKNQYVYGAINRLEQAVNGSGAKANYLYNGLGHRVGKQEAENQEPMKRISYLIDLTKEYHNLLEKTEDTNVQTYFWDGNVALYEENGRRNYYLQDDLGSPIRIEGEDGILQETYGYGAFGEELYDIQGGIQPFGYTGYQRDSVAGTYYAQAREYNARAGRFVGQDVIAGVIEKPFSMNRYTYCFNMPMVLVDLNGAWPKWIEKTANAIKEFWNSNIYGETTILYKQDLYGNTYEVKEHTGGNIWVNKYVVNNTNGKEIRNFAGWSINARVEIPGTGYLFNQSISGESWNISSWKYKESIIIKDKKSNLYSEYGYGFDKNGMNILVAAGGDTGNLPIPLPNSKVFDSKSKISWSLANEKNFMKWNKIGEVALVAAAVTGMVILILDDGTIIGVLDDFILAPLAAYIATVAPSLYQWIINSIPQMTTCGG